MVHSCSSLSISRRQILCPQRAAKTLNMTAYRCEMGGPRRHEGGASHHMLKGGFLYLHSAEVPKTTMTTFLFALGRWWQQREALDVPDGPEARCAKHGGAKPSLERPTPPLFVAGMVEQTEEKMHGWIGWWQASKRRRRSLPCDELVVCYVRRSSKSSFLVLFLVP